MLFPVILFTVFTIFWTTGNIIYGILVFGIGLMFYIFYYLFFLLTKYKKNTLTFSGKKFGISLIIYICCGLVSFLSTYIYQTVNIYVYPSSINDIGTITAITGPNRYVIKINNQKWIAKSNTKYHIGDQIQILAKINNKSEYPNNIYKLSERDNSSFLLGGKFDYNRRLAMKGYAGDLKIISSKYLGRSEGLIGYIYDARDSLSNLSKQLFTQKNTLGLVLGLLIGDRSAIDKETNADFINSGLVHILAVSGGNISMLVLLLSLLFFWLPYYVRISVIGILVILYGILCGADSSVVRAVIMATIATLGLFGGKEINIRRLLGITYVLMLLLNPYALTYDLGFSLSFSAIVGLLLFDFREYFTNRLLYPIREWILPSVGANLGVLPILILASGKINIFSLFANFVVLPILPVILLMSVIILIFGNNFIGFYSLLINIIDNLTDWIFSVNFRVSKNGYYIHFDLFWVKYVIVIFCIIGWILIYNYNVKKDNIKILENL